MILVWALLALVWCGLSLVVLRSPNRTWDEDSAGQRVTGVLGQGPSAPPDLAYLRSAGRSESGEHSEVTKADR